MEKLGVIVVGALLFGWIGSFFGDTGTVIGVILGIICGLNSDSEAAKKKTLNSENKENNDKTSIALATNIVEITTEERNLLQKRTEEELRKKKLDARLKARIREKKNLKKEIVVASINTIFKNLFLGAIFILILWIPTSLIDNYGSWIDKYNEWSFEYKVLAPDREKAKALYVVAQEAIRRQEAIESAQRKVEEKRKEHSRLLAEGREKQRKLLAEEREKQREIELKEQQKLSYKFGKIAEKTGSFIEEKLINNEVKKGIKKFLRDPRSAEFTEFERKKINGEDVIVGKVNAKNSFGGYTGAKEFVVNLKTGKVQMDE